MPLQEWAKIISNEKVKQGYYLMQLSAPQIAQEAQPGQFVHIRIGNSMDPLLRRPISLYDIDANNGVLRLLYVVVGKGTRMLSEMEAGTEVDIMGPLGQGFSIPDNTTRFLVVGGGIGVAPLLPLIKWLDEKGLQQKIIYGFRCADVIVGIDEIQQKGLPLSLATDDGSLGHKGFVTDLAEQTISEFKPEYYFTCGPEPMIKSVVDLMKKNNINGQVSLEARMGCGVGACLACTCKTKADKQDQPFDYKMVCTHGPVFSADEVMMDE